MPLRLLRPSLWLALSKEKLWPIDIAKMAVAEGASPDLLLVGVPLRKQAALDDTKRCQTVRYTRGFYYWCCLAGLGAY